MRIQLAWVREDGTIAIQELEVPHGSRLGQVLAGLDDPMLREGLTAGRLAASVFGQARRPDEPLFEGDRIELVEGLRIDPKLARQRRVEVRRRQLAQSGAKGSRARVAARFRG